MKVKDLLEELEHCKSEYGDDFLEWDVYTEQICEMDKVFKKDTSDGGQNWEWITDSEEWEYFKCYGFWAKFPEEKIFTINVNY